MRHLKIEKQFMGRLILIGFLGLLILSCNLSAQSLDYTLRETLTISVPSQSSVIHVGDMDGDQVIDILLFTTISGSSRRWQILERDGPGFQTRFTFSFFGRFPHVRVADVDGDGLPEVSTDTNGSQAWIHESSGDNTYVLRRILSTGSFIERTLAGDSDGDGKLEWLVARETFPSRVYIFEAIADNVFDGQGSLTGAGGDVGLAGTYDLDGDGLQELVFSDNNYRSPGFRNRRSVYVYENHSLVYSDPGARLGTNSLGDTDGNGLGEIIGVDPVTRYLKILESTGNGDNFQVVFNAPPNSYSFVVLDVDEDGQSEFWRRVDGGFGQLDVFTLAHRSGSTISDFYSSGPLLQGFAGGIRRIIPIGDTNRNGSLELAVWQGSQIHILEQGGNQPPLADAGSNQTVACATPAGATATLDGRGSSDPDGDPLTFSWSAPGITFNDPTSPTPTGIFPSGATTVTLIVTDPGGLSSTATVTITGIADTTPPEITLNGDNPTVLECAMDAYTEPGATASDVCDPDPSLAISGTVDTDVPEDYTITYTSEDASGNISTKERLVQVRDTTPPEIEAALIPVVGSGDDDEDDDDGSGNLFMVSVLGTDLCDPHPAETACIVQPLGPTDQFKLKFKKKKGGDDDDGGGGTVKIKIKFKKNKIKVELKGPDQQFLENLLDQAIQKGGFPVTDGQKVKLVVTGGGNDDDDDGGNGGTWKFVFDANGNLICASGPGLILRAFATDASGNVSDIQDVPVPQKGNGNNQAKVAKIETRGGNGLSAGLDPLSGSPEVRFALDSGEPLSFRLHPNAPNPFNPSTTIRYDLPEGSHVRLTIFNLMGQRVRVLVNAEQGSGVYNVQWDGRDEVGYLVASGLYIYRLEAGAKVAVRKMTFAK